MYKNNLSPLNHTHHPGYKFVFGDMTDRLKIEKLILGSDAVVSLAGLVGDLITKKYPTQSRKINDLGVKQVIDLCAEKNVEKLIYISTCSNYGFINNFCCVTAHRTWHPELTTYGVHGRFIKTAQLFKFFNFPCTSLT